MRLLLCEDERELSAALCRLLKHHNYEVDAVYDGQAALDYLETENYDGVLLDIMMPRRSGLEVLEALRAEGKTVPVLLLTAKSTVPDKVAGLDLGANDYLTKPFDLEELLARIRAMTRTATESTTSLLTLGNLTLNRATYRLSTATDEVKLAGKEFQILELLMMNRGHVISAERLIEKIWGYDSDIEANVVWVYLSHLRKKLTQLGANVAIKATRNTGYSVEVV